MNPAAGWSRMLPRYAVECCNINYEPNPTNTYYQLCFDSDYWGPESCKPEARAMHTITFGTFVAGKQSLLVYGGVQEEGKALQDLWYIDVSEAGNAFTAYLQFEGLSNKATWPADTSVMFADLKTIVVQMVSMPESEGGVPWTKYGRPGGISWASLDLFDTGYDSKMDNFYVRLRFEQVNGLADPESEDTLSYWFFVFDQTLAPTLWVAARNASALASGVFDNASLECPSTVDPTFPSCCKRNDDIESDVLMLHTQYDDQDSCDIAASDAKCMRGVCMGSTADTQGLVTTDEFGDVQYCYRTGTAMRVYNNNKHIQRSDGRRNGHYGHYQRLHVQSSGPTSRARCLELYSVG